MKKRLIFSLLLTTVLLPAAAGAHPVVVELFTSQGCPACPPADEIFSGMVEDNPDVLALAFHVDYWDGRGWKDPFGSPKFSDRQHDYADVFGSTSVFTPQIIVNGMKSLAGGRQRDIYKAIKKAAESDAPAVDVTLEMAADGKKIRGSIVPESEEARGPADIWLVTYNERNKNRISWGENIGVTFDNRHTVNYLARLGEWKGGNMEFTMDNGSSADYAAIIVQRPNMGEVLGGASVALGEAD